MGHSSRVLTGALALVLAILAPRAALAAVTVVGSDYAKGNASASSYSITLNQAPTSAGSHIIYVVTLFAHNPETITYPDGNWTQVTHSDTNGCDLAVRVVQAGDTASLGSFGFSASTTSQALAGERAGASTTSIVDKSVCGTATSSTLTVTTSSRTPSQGGTMPIAAFGTVDTIATRCTTACTPQAGWTETAVTASGSIAEQQADNTSPSGSVSGQYNLTAIGSSTLRWILFNVNPAPPNCASRLILLGAGC